MIRIFKLTNGASIIGIVTNDQKNFFSVKNVFMIERRMNHQGDVFEVLSCYTSYIKDKEDTVDINKSQIVFFYEPSEGFSKYYLNTTNSFWTEMVPVMNAIVESYSVSVEEEPKEEVNEESKESTDNVIPMKPTKTIH